MAEHGYLIEQFFKDFERAGHALDIDRILTQFADPFLHADPNGTRAVKRADFPAALKKRKEFFASLGLKTTSIQPLEETRLDDVYTMVRARVVMQFEKVPGQPVDVQQHATYVISVKEATPQIVMYLNHDDLTTVLRHAGLVPDLG
jgi:hypothetical protein